MVGLIDQDHHGCRRFRKERAYFFFRGDARRWIIWIANVNEPDIRLSKHLRQVVTVVCRQRNLRGFPSGNARVAYYCLECRICYDESLVWTSKRGRSEFK